MLMTPSPHLKEQTEEGFTLIELLVVILIIGILAAIAIPSFLNQRQSAVDSTVTADITNANMVLETWQTNHYNTAVPTFTVTESSPSPVEDIGAIHVSDGTTLTITPNATVVGEYIIVGTNDGGDEAKDGITFNSATGGF